jgi:uncharacterized membrane protein YdjX (TVP38/TMEM64 family)
MKKRELALLGALILLGASIEVFDLVDWRAGLEWARGHVGGWYLPVAIVLAQLVLFTFAQPGSILFWVAALLYAPPAATAILTAGGTSGALGAYLLARRVTRLDPVRAREQRLFRLLERQGDFYTLCALRVVPGMPHSLLNYTAGTLALPLTRFLVASAIGLAVKSYLYASAIAGAVGTASPADLVRPGVLGPLFGIAALLLLGRLSLGWRENRARARSKARRRALKRMR